MFGHKIGGAGAAMTFIFFFAPWVLFSCGATPIGEFSGYQLASGQIFSQISQAQQFNVSENAFAILWLIPLISVALIGIAFLAHQKQSAFISSQIDGVLLIGGAFVQVLIIFNRLDVTRQASMNPADAAIMGSMIQVHWQYGLFITIIGALMMAFGGYQVIRNNY